MHKLIYCTRPIPEIGLTMLYEKGFSVDIGTKEHIPTKESIITDLSQKEYFGLISFLTDTIDEEVMSACPSLKIISNYAVGYNNIDLEAAERKNITVTNSRGSSSKAVAESTVALIFALTTRLVEGHMYTHEGKYTGWDPDLLLGLDVSNKIVGLIGLGEIGKHVATMLHHGFGCTILYYDIQKNEEIESSCGATLKTVDEICKESDIISLHVPLLPETTHLINKDRFDLMKKEAILINTARGPVVSENDLTDALYQGKIWGAALDVYEHEPEINEKLKHFNNVILTPHIASARTSVRERMSQMIAEDIITFIETGTPLRKVKK